MTETIPKSVQGECKRKSFLFFALVFLAAVFQTKLILSAVQFETGRIYAWLWLAGFVCLSFNVSIVLVQSVFAFFVREPVLAEVETGETKNAYIALVLCVKNEPDGVLERIRYSLRGNLGANVDFWLLSDSDARHVPQEEEWARRLHAEFGGRIFYRHRSEPYERKQGNIAEWFESRGNRYDFFFVLDADSTIPEGTLAKLVQKAMHPANSDIGIFQAAVYIVHDHSLFARAAAVGQFYAQRLYFRVNQAVFGRSISFGHNGLIRSEAFREMKLPAGVLSHDNWDTALLDRAGYRTVFAVDCVTFEEATRNYLEERSRARRWMKGTLQGWPILFMSGITFQTRFLIFYQIYLYLVHPIFFFWILLGLVGGSRWFQNGLFVSHGIGSVNPVLLSLFFTFIVLFGHKFLLARSFADFKRISFEVILSTLVSLNNIFYVTRDFFVLPFEKLVWHPMGKDPNAKISLASCTRALLSGTLFGLAALFWGMLYSPFWTFTGAPVLLSLVLSIPTVWLTSKNLVAL